MDTETGRPPSATLAAVSSSASPDWGGPPHRVIWIHGVEPNDDQLFGALKQNPGVDLEQITLSTPLPRLIPAPFDVSIISLSHENLETLSFSLRMRKRFGHPEMVFVTDDLAGPIASGLAELGVELIVPLHLASEWLSEELPTLTIMARTRRAHDAAKARLGLARGTPYPDLRATTGLFAAEQAYRETYVRALLSLTDSRREAAARARISYRTLSHILTKLGITTRPSREPSDSPAEGDGQDGAGKLERASESDGADNVRQS